MRALLLAALVLAPAAAALAETDRVSARSVVQIRCVADGGTMKATGFVWPKPGLVVTALHAVAGCGPASGIVYSQHTRREAELAEIVAVDRESDLALIRLSDDLGLPAVAHAEAPPDTRARHVVWGYPLAAEQMIDLGVEFAGGLEGGVTTLGSAFSSAELTKLFREQGYPSRETRILRVTSTIQPGHSGAPIFDAEGRVVAIADGGLLGGWRGINWSIPAHVYLAGLPLSDDPLPEAVSPQAELFSAYAVEDEVVVALGGPADGWEEAAAAAPDLASIGQIPLPLVLEVLGTEEDEDSAWIVEELAAILPNRATWEAFLFEALQDTRDGTIHVVPARATVEFDPDTGTLEAISVDGTARQFLFRQISADFDEALAAGAATLLGRARMLGASGDLPEGIPPDNVDAELEFAEYDAAFESFDGAGEIVVFAQANGTDFYGGGIMRDRGSDEMSDADWVDYLMMELAVFGLNGLDTLEPEFEERLTDLGTVGNFAPEPSALTLVRRVPLADVAQDFVADQDFGWKRDIVELKSRLADPAQFDDLLFDVYEDRATGATIAVPQGLTLDWNAEMGAAEAVAGDGRVHLAVAIQSAPSFRAAAGAGPSRFTGALTPMADWDGEAPSDCELAVYPDDRLAECWGYFQGTDRQTGEFADIYLALTVEGNAFLGTSVYIVGEEEDLGDDEVITYLMMLIGAEYLSDFAAK